VFRSRSHERRNAQSGRHRTASRRQDHHPLDPSDGAGRKTLRRYLSDQSRAQSARRESARSKAELRAQHNRLARRRRERRARRYDTHRRHQAAQRLRRSATRRWRGCAGVVAPTRQRGRARLKVRASRAEPQRHLHRKGERNLMTKLLAIIKREYVQRVRSRMFLVATILGPLVMFSFTVVPALIFQINAGGAQRVAIVDETGRLYERVREVILRAEDEDKADDEQSSVRTNEEMRNGNLKASARRPSSVDDESAYILEQVAPAGRALEDVKRELNERVRRNELDAYIILPRDILETGKAEYYARNLGDEDAVRRLQDRVSEAVSDERLAARGIDPQLVRASSQRIELTPQKAGAAGAAGGRGGFGLAFGIGFLIYLTILLYGQVVLGAVVEEKATRLTEMLFSSVDTFKLMIGKLLGVSLVALTQVPIW